jgi:hypothetical protein
MQLDIVPCCSMLHIAYSILQRTRCSETVGCAWTSLSLRCERMTSCRQIRTHGIVHGETYVCVCERELQCVRVTIRGTSHLGRTTNDVRELQCVSYNQGHITLRAYNDQLRELQCVCVSYNQGHITLRANNDQLHPTDPRPSNPRPP